MFDTTDALLEKIRLGKDQWIEFKVMVFAGSKVKGPNRDDVANELAAFANAGGGVFLFGVDDKTREVVGVPVDRLDLAEKFAVEAARDLIVPPLFPRIERLQLPGVDGTSRPVLKIDVPKSLFVHRSPGGYFHRVGSSKREMDTDYLLRLGQQRSQTRLIRFDEQPVPDTTLGDLVPHLVDRFRTPRTGDDLSTFARKVAMASEDDQGVLRLSVAGVLLGCEHPERWMANAFVQAVAYRGEDRTDFMGGPEFDGNRWNDLHYTLKAKQQARERAATVPAAAEGVS